MSSEQTSRLRGVHERVVTEADTATAWGDQFPPAASTPFALGLAEVACHSAVESGLNKGEITVGIGATIRHLAPSPVGATLRGSAELIERNGRHLSFSVKVEDDGQVVAEVEHSRVIVDRDAMLERLQPKS